MKKFLIFLIATILLLMPVSYGAVDTEKFDANVVSFDGLTGGDGSDLNPIWAYYTTGTRYILKYYDFNDEK